MNESQGQKRLLIVLYLAFISLGLPDAVLGVAWPEMRREFQAGLEWAGWLLTLTTLISAGASLAVVWRLKHHHAGRVLALSATTTTLALLGYGLSPGLWFTIICTLLFGIGQGAVDSAINAHLSRHYGARHMNLVHGCWGLGAAGGPLVLAAIFGLGLSWRWGYLGLALIQLALTIYFIATLGLWPKIKAGEPLALPQPSPARHHQAPQPSPSRAAAGVAFYFFYPGLEVVLGLWGASYLTEILRATNSSAGAALAAYWLCLTLGRFGVGFLATGLANKTIIRLGLGLATTGLALTLITSGALGFTLALTLIGLGLAPLYPTMMHETPQRAGLERSDKIIGFQVGAALAGAAVLPMGVGLMVREWGLAALPLPLVASGVILIVAHEISAATTK